MPERFERRRFDSDLNKIRRSLSPQQRLVIDKIQGQVVDLNSDLKDSKEEVKQKNIQLRQNNATISKLTKDLQAKTRQYNAALKQNEALKTERDNFATESSELKLSRDALVTEVRKKDGEIEQLNSRLQAKTKEYDDALKQNEVLKTERDNLATESLELKRSRNALVAEVGKKDVEIGQLNSRLQAKTKECDEALKSIRTYKAEVANLTSEYTKIKELYDGIQAQKQRPIATPTQLSSAFREAMEAMRREVATLEDSPVDYVVSRFDISLKTGIGTDKEGKVSFQLPKEEEIANPENLSTIQFSIKSVPKIRK